MEDERNPSLISDHVHVRSVTGLYLDVSRPLPGYVEMRECVSCHSVQVVRLGHSPLDEPGMLVPDLKLCDCRVCFIARLAHSVSGG